MSHEILIGRLFDALVSGDRDGARAIIDETARRSIPAESVLADLCWPVYENIERLYRADQMTALSHHMGTRLLRVLCDQTALRLTRQAPRGRSVFAACGPNDADELAAQIAVDLLEREGFRISFSGGGIAGDEIMAQVQETQPDVLLLFASAPPDLPGIRNMIDSLREIGACKHLQIVVGGGVFNRADGLAEEIGADLWATSPSELVNAMVAFPDRRARASQHTVGRKRRVREAA